MSTKGRQAKKSNRKEGAKKPKMGKKKERRKERKKERKKERQLNYKIFPTKTFGPERLRTFFLLVRPCQSLDSRVG